MIWWSRFDDCPPVMQFVDFQHIIAANSYKQITSNFIIILCISINDNMIFIPITFANIRVP